MTDPEAMQDSIAPVAKYLGVTTPGDRPDSLLTTSMREFLYNPQSIAESSVDTYRMRIRNRVRAGVRDFEYLNFLPERDVRLIFTKQMDPEERHEVIRNGLVFFYYAAKVGGDIDFEAALETAVAMAEMGPRHESEGGDRQFKTIDVNVNINQTRRRVLSKSVIKERARDRDTLNQREMGALAQYAAEDGECAELLEEHMDRLKADQENSDED